MADKESGYFVRNDRNEIPLVSPPVKIKVDIQNGTNKIHVGTWNHIDKFVPNEGYTLEKVKRFFRVGIVLGLLHLSFRATYIRIWARLNVSCFSAALKCCLKRLKHHQMLLDNNLGTIFL